MIKVSRSIRPECEQFLLIKTKGASFQTINEFVLLHPNPSEELLNTCDLCYRGKDLSYKDFINEYLEISEAMQFVRFQKPLFLLNDDIDAAAYFTSKAGECLQFARFFTMKSALLLDADYNMHWSQGYVPQFWFRCIYFGTSTTWYSNAFDHVLQSIYWAKRLYTSVSDRNDQPFDATWDAKKIMENCTYEFVVGELKTRGLVDCRKHLTVCWSRIEEVRKWANYIKHKGGIDYKYLEAKLPMKMVFVPNGEKHTDSPKCYRPEMPSDKYELTPFKSPIEVDIDEKLQTLIDAHKSIFQCIEETIQDINFDLYRMNM